MSLVYLCVFSSGVYLYSRILMYVKHHEQFEIGCGSILKYSFIIIIIITFSPFNPLFSFRVAGLAISLHSFPVLSPFFHSLLWLFPHSVLSFQLGLPSHSFCLYLHLLNVSPFILSHHMTKPPSLLMMTPSHDSTTQPTQDDTITWLNHPSYSWWHHHMTQPPSLLKMTQSKDSTTQPTHDDTITWLNHPAYSRWHHHTTQPPSLLKMTPSHDSTTQPTHDDTITPLNHPAYSRWHNHMTQPPSLLMMT